MIIVISTKTVTINLTCRVTAALPGPPPLATIAECESAEAGSGCVGSCTSRVTVWVCGSGWVGSGTVTVGPPGSAVWGVASGTVTAAGGA